jgi:hypothetical protein
MIVVAMSAIIFSESLSTEHKRNDWSVLKELSLNYLNVCVLFMQVITALPEKVCEILFVFFFNRLKKKITYS